MNLFFLKFFSELNYDYIKFGVFHGFIVSTYGLRHYLVKFSFKLVSKHLLFLVLNSLVSIAIFLGGEKINRFKIFLFTIYCLF